jgi:hypothetical protein
VALSYLTGGHVRIGLEDSVYLERGVLAQSNAALVAKTRRIVEDLGGQIATAAETRVMLGLARNNEAQRAACQRRQVRRRELGLLAQVLLRVPSS